MESQILLNHSFLSGFFYSFITILDVIYFIRRGEIQKMNADS